MALIVTCAGCGSEDVPNFGRGLCRKCYFAHRTIGTLDQFPPLSTSAAPGPAEQNMPMDEISYRQLDYWTRRGYLRADNPTPGSGRNRTWADSEHLVARTMARLIRAGLTLEAAHRVARGQSELAPGVFVVLIDATATPSLNTVNAPRWPAPAGF